MNEELISERVKICAICKQELSPLEYLYHDKCTECEFCHSPVHKDIIAKLIIDGKTIHHSPCYDAKLKADFDQLDVTIKQAHLDMLNRAMFAFQPNKELAFDTNQLLCENNYRDWFGNMDLDSKFLVVKNLEAIAAMMHVLIGKDKKYVTDMHEKRQIEKFKERDNAVAELENRKQKQTEANQRSFERLDKDARARRNSIDGFIKLLGISEEAATKMVDEAKATKK